MKNHIQMNRINQYAGSFAFVYISLFFLPRINIKKKLREREVKILLLVHSGQTKKKKTTKRIGNGREIKWVAFNKCPGR